MPTIRIPTPLRPYAGGQAEVAVSGGTVGAALGDLTARHPGLRQHLYSDGGELRSFVNVFLNQSDIREMKGADTPLAENDRLMIIPSIAGGGDELSVDRELDCSDMLCPMPVIKTSKAVKEMTTGQVLKMIATDPGAPPDMVAWARQTGNTLLSSTTEGEKFVFVIRKK